MISVLSVYCRHTSPYPTNTAPFLRRRAIGGTGCTGRARRFPRIYHFFINIIAFFFMLQRSQAYNYARTIFFLRVAITSIIPKIAFNYCTTCFTITIFFRCRAFAPCSHFPLPIGRITRYRTFSNATTVTKAPWQLEKMFIDGEMP